MAVFYFCSFADESAINAKEFVVKFNKAIDKDTVISSGNVINSAFTVNGNALTGTNPATLSADGKTLTITAGTGTWEGTYMFGLVKDAVKATDKKVVAEFNKVVSYEDTVAPTFTSVERVNATTVKVNFSEPIKNKGTVTAKLADGTDISSLVSSSAVGSSVELNLSNANIPVGKDISVTFVGTTDYSDNLVSPNPITATVSKGDKDGVAPEISSVTPVNAKKFEIKLTEQVENFAIGDIKVDGVALTAPAKLTQDSVDKTKYTVELAAAKQGLVTVAVDADAFADLSGQGNKAFSKIVNFTADTVNPTVSSAAVSKNSDGKEVLTLTFSEDVTKIATGTVTLSAKKVKDYVTSSVNVSFAAADLTPVSGKSNQFTIELSKISEAGPVALVEGATYTVDLVASLVEDTAGNDNEAKTSVFSFTRGVDADSTKPAVVTTFDGDETDTNLVDNNGIKVVNNNTLKAKFSIPVDGATATNKANYQVTGATVESVTLLAGNEVEIKLSQDSNSYTGLRAVKISGVKSKEGVVMNDFNTTEYLYENVRPVVTAVKLTGVTQDDASTTGTNEAESTVALTFSEAVTVGTTNTADFDLYIKGEKVTSGVTISTAAGSSDNVVVVTIAGKALSAQELSDGVELKAQSTIDIQDASKNTANIPAGIKVNL
ncbi:hypothetical protein [Cytobacillus oceanisediminis]|uniref:hypothetical protein n=1 Tax=Cytobacillus oceanisediminis TaxID=665099 RepID=UPI00204184C7|nr:hypothetical protein [Cytobacillus oceanisediminis]MCM3404821.1 hypothetical protein [Cytobacillus oceanisediminis]